MEYLSIKENEKILIIAPHPDDECIGVGGLLLNYSDRCSVLVLTDGCIGQGNHTKEDTKQIRRKEFVAEMEYLNIKDYDFLDIMDGTLSSYTDCLYDKDLSVFSKIFVTGRGDGHPDHKAAFVSVIKAVEYQGIETQIYEYEVHSPIASPTHMIDISNSIENKKTLVRYHQSQIASFPYDELAEVNAKYRAMQDRRKTGYIEVYKLIENKDSVSDNNYDIEIKLQKHIRFYQLLTKWMEKRNSGSHISSYLTKKKIQSVAVYGYAELGRLTVNELLKSKTINVCYAMDKREFDKVGIRVLKPSSANPVVDAVIVTAINSYDDIKDELTSLGFMNVLSLSEVIDNM